MRTKKAELPGATRGCCWRTTDDDDDDGDDDEKGSP